MSLASNPWPASFETSDEGARRTQHEMNNTRPHPPRFRPVRSDQTFGISRSTSHDAGWNTQTHQNVGRVAPTVGVVQPLNAVRPLPTQTVSDPYVQKQNSRRNNPPHVPPRNDVAGAQVIPTIPNQEHRIVHKEHIKEQKENIKPASDPWKATPEQKRFYSDEFEKLPKVQEYIEGYLCSFIEGAVAKDFFLKSKLPNDELIHIWELSDIDRDGRLTKLEFSLAFHFTSARRNNFPLPEQIPNQLYNDLMENDYIEQPDNKDDENWETFSEKSFSTVSSASTLPKFATTMSNKTEIFQPVPMRMTPSSMAARTSHPYQDEPTCDENSIESKRRMYLNLNRTPADGSSSAQSSSSSSPVSDQSVGINESQSNLSYSSSKPLKSSSGESSESDDEETSQKGDFADFQSFQKLIKKEGETSIDETPVSIRSSISSDCNDDSHQNLEEDTPEVPQEVKLSSTDNVMTSSATSASVSEQRDREIEQVRSMVASLKERNIRLTRLNMALSIELKDIISERVLLEARNDE